MAFTVYRRETERGPIGLRGKISFHKDGVIGIGSLAWRLALDAADLEAAGHAQMFWDSDRRAIGVSPRVDKDDTTAKVSANGPRAGCGSKGSYRILATAFLRWAGLDPVNLKGRHGPVVRSEEIAGIEVLLNDPW